MTQAQWIKLDGQTKRCLKTGTKEHENNVRMDTNKHLVITEHRIKNNYNFKQDDVRILDMIYITKTENTLNK